MIHSYNVHICLFPHSRMSFLRKRNLNIMKGLWSTGYSIDVNACHWCFCFCLECVFCNKLGLNAYQRLVTSSTFMSNISFKLPWQEWKPLHLTDPGPIHIPGVQERAERLLSKFKGKPNKPPKVNTVVEQLDVVMPLGYYLWQPLHKWNDGVCVRIL